MSYGKEAMRCIVNNTACKKIPTATKSQISRSQATSSAIGRRRSLTLSTASGLPFTVNPRSRYHQVTKQLVDKRPDDLNPVKAKRNSSGITSLQNPENLCPFHSMISRERRINSHDGNHTVQTDHAFSNFGMTLMQKIFGKKWLKKESILHQSSSLLSTLTSRKREGTSVAQKSYSAIPGPRGVPFLGSVLEYTILGSFNAREFHKAIQSRHSKYGKIFKERYLSEEFVYTSDPDDLNLIARNEGSAPIRPHLDVIVESRKQEGFPAGITAVQGEEWRRLRSAVNATTMKPKVVRSYAKAQKVVSDDFLAVMKENICPQTGEIPEFEILLNKWALESVAVVLLDTRLGLVHHRMNSETDPIADRLRKAMDIFFDYGARLTFGAPIWKMWHTKEWKIFRKCQREEFECAGHYVDKKLADLIKNSTDSKPGRNDMQSFLEYMLKNTDLKRNESVNLCIELLAGGIDTTSNAVTFTLYELSKHPEKQEKLRELLMQDADDEIPPQTSESSRYLRGCVMEALRLHPLTFVNMRKTTKDLVLSGYQVPAGTVVRYTQHLMHTKNDEYFPEAEKFIPERWVSRSSPHRCTKQFVFTPFGHGARQCPGRRIAEQELDLLLRAILLNFRVEYHHEDIGTTVRLFNNADKPARFSFSALHF